MNKLTLPPPHSAALPAEEVHAGRRLTEALVGLAAEHARDQGVSIPRARRDAVIVGALVTALASVRRAPARVSSEAGRSGGDGGLFTGDILLSPVFASSERGDSFLA